MLAAIGDFYHWPRGDIEGLTAAEARYYLNAAATLRARQQEERERNS